MNREATYFHSPTDGKLTFDELVKLLAETVGGESATAYKVIVGSDSSARDYTSLTTVVIFYRQDRGGRYFYTRSGMRHFSSLADRIFAETVSSITLTQELRSGLREELRTELPDINLEVHVDIGYRGPTRELVDAVTGMLQGYDLVPVIKPDAFAASSVADRHT